MIYFQAAPGTGTQMILQQNSVLEKKISELESEKEKLEKKLQELTTESSDNTHGLSKELDNLKKTVTDLETKLKETDYALNVAESR